jgi:hypothetical protein
MVGLRSLLHVLSGNHGARLAVCQS